MKDAKESTIKKSRNDSEHEHFYWMAIFFPFVVFILCVLLFRFIVNYLNYWVGAPVSLVLCILAIAWIRGAIQDLWIERFENPLPMFSFTANISALITVALLLLTVGAWVSYALTKAGLATISAASPAPSYERLVSTYAWHLIDLIPFTNVEKTFGMKEPLVQFKGWAGGMPILVFRLLIIVIILSTIKETWKQFRMKSEELFIEKVRKAVNKDRLHNRTD